MKWLSAGLTFVNVAAISGLILGMAGNGLSELTAEISLGLGLAAACYAWLTTFDSESLGESANTSRKRYSSFWVWLMAAIFTIFAVRSFAWLLYVDGNNLRIQSTNNLGDLALHVTYIREFANGAPLWPANPIFPIGRIRYPAGTDLFNALLLLAHVDLLQGLAWAGLAGAAATFYALYRWGRSFALAGFLFNGGTAGFLILQELWTSHTLTFIDYQGEKVVAWKSIPLSMFVTQRGWLYAIPAGLLLLWHWRKKFYRQPPNQRGPLPFWVEYSLYASMPLFHVHTFLALSVVLACLFVFGNPQMRGHIITLVVGAVVPATFFVWTVTDHFSAGSIVKWHPGWVVRKDAGDLYHPFFTFWLYNFGVWMPLILVLYGVLLRAAWHDRFRESIRETGQPRDLIVWKDKLWRMEKLPEAFAFLIPAAIVFLLGLLWKFAPWEWDNLKLMVWGYFIVLPYLWRDLIARWQLPPRLGACFVLFLSGFVSLFGGLATPSYDFANRGELDAVGVAVRNLPVTARFATYPTYNHPVLLQGRTAILGYGGHLWTQGFDYGRIEAALKEAMSGNGDWRGNLQRLGARYLFWGREEQTNYPNSSHPWDRSLVPVAKGDWGAIYDLGEPRSQ